MFAEIADIQPSIAEVQECSRTPWLSSAELWLEAERERLPLLVPVALGCGICCWQLFGDRAFLPLLGVCTGTVLMAFALGRASLLGRAMLFGVMLLALGFGIIAGKSALFGAQPLDKPWTGRLVAQVQSVEHVAARGILRYRLFVGDRQQVPRIVRVNVAVLDARDDIAAGTIVGMKARLMPPPGPALPGGYDFARTAWFAGIGATGRAIGPVEVVRPVAISSDFWGQARNAFAARIERSLGSETGPVGAALLVGTRGSISEDDAEALRNSGMAHLLSVSGLHVTAVVGGSYFLIAALLALSPLLALRVPIPLLAAAGSALVAVGYTLLTGSEVPTVRACIAALLILAAISMGREALSFRLLAAGATFVLLFWPESLAGPSFQLSFAAVGTIIVLHDSAWVRKWTARRDEALQMRLARNFAALLLTGFAIELVLAPIALFHFHKSGLYGALANVAAIPLTTFAIMPLQLLGLLGDQVHAGLGAPFWWAAGQGIAIILRMAHFVSSAPGAITMLPEMPVWAFATLIFSGLVIAVFAGRWRWFLIVPMAAAATAMITTPRPDMLVTGDGKHLAVLTDDGRLALLRPRAGDYARSILGETAAVKEDAIDLEQVAGAKCNLDSCAFSLRRGGRDWRVLALRSEYPVPAMELAAACKRSDIVIASRWLPRSCKPGWVKADRNLLEHSGGLAFYLDESRLTSVAEENAHHPWSAYRPERLAQRAAERAKAKAAKSLPPPLPNLKPKS
jgi:competence protein ComEC